MITSHSHYGLREMPFRLTPDHRYFFESAGHGHALAHLTYGLSQAEGFIVVTGDVGAGKTTLLGQAFNLLDKQTFEIGQVVTTQLSGDDLLRIVSRAFGGAGGGNKAELLTSLEARLREHRRAGRRSLLAIDEVQNLSTGALEELRMLSNIVEAGRPLLQTLLMGQPQFRRTLAMPEFEQLRQRVLASYHLGPLSPGETHLYIRHRLVAAGWVDRPSWPEATSARVYLYSEGVPRQVNRLCARLLLYGSLEESESITPEMVDATAAELEADLAAGPSEVPAAPASREVSTRLDALEELVGRRERIFRRLLELFGG